jgi:hypothetical protein
MSTQLYRSLDGHWQVRHIVLNGRPLLRVEADHPVMPAGEIPGRRTGPCQLYPGWWLQAYCGSVPEITRWVSPAELEEA